MYIVGGGWKAAYFFFSRWYCLGWWVNRARTCFSSSSAGTTHGQDDSPLIHLASGSWVWNSALNRSSTANMVSLPGWLSTAREKTGRNNQAMNCGRRAQRGGSLPNPLVSRFQSHPGAEAAHTHDGDITRPLKVFFFFWSRNGWSRQLQQSSDQKCAHLWFLSDTNSNILYFQYH